MLWTKLRRDIVAYKGMFASIIVTVLLGVMVFAATYSSYRNLDASYQRTFDELSVANLTVSGGQIDEFAARAARIDGVEHVVTRTVVDVPLRLNGEDTLLGRVVGMSPDQAPPVNAVDVLEGRYLESSRPNGVLAEQHMAQEWDLHPGDTLEVLGAEGWRTVSVQGEALSAEYLWPTRSRQDTMPLPEDYGVIFVSQALAEQISGSTAPTETIVAFDGGADNPSLSSRLLQAATAVGAGTAGVQTLDDQPSNAFLRTDIDAFGSISKVFPMVFLIAAAIATYVLLTRRVHAERRVIGTLLAHGVRRRAIVTHYLSFGLLAGIAGAVPGVVVGAGLAGLITTGYASFMKLEMVVKDVYLEAIIAGLAFGIVTGMVSAALPALLASRVTPADAMRSVAPAGRGRVSVLERVVPGFSRLPVGGRVVLRNLERSRRRSGFTVIGVGMALALVVVAWGSIDSMRTWIDRQFVDVAKQDARVLFDGVNPTGRDLAAIAAIEGVASAERTINLPASFNGPDGRYDTFLVGLEDDTTMHGFRHHDGASWPVGDGVIVGRELNTKTGADIGETITATLPGAGRTIELQIAGFLDEPMGTLVYLPLDGFAETVGAAAMATPGIGSVLVDYQPGVDRDAVGQAIGGLPGVATVEDSRGLYDLVDDWMALMYGFAAIMLIFGSLMAFALIFIMMTVNIAERIDEMGTMQAVGVPHRRISRMLMGENLAMAMVGIVPGLIIGSYLVDLVMSSYINDMWRFEGIVLRLSMIVSALGIVLVALLSQAPSIRAIRRLDVADIVRNRGV